MINKQLLYLGCVFLVLSVLVFGLSQRASRGSAAASLAGVKLTSLDKTLTQDMGDCATPKCLTMYVSPWCSVCRAGTGMLIEFRDYLNRNNVQARVVVGRDKPGEVDAYARKFGPKTLLDAEGRFPLRGGVPNFTVTNGSGEVLKVLPGLPGIYKPPVPEKIFIRFGEMLGLFPS